MEGRNRLVEATEEMRGAPSIIDGQPMYDPRPPRRPMTRQEINESIIAELRGDAPPSMGGNIIMGFAGPATIRSVRARGAGNSGRAFSPKDSYNAPHVSPHIPSQHVASAARESADVLPHSAVEVVRDAEGRAITAPLVAGVRTPGGAPTPLTQGELHYIIEHLTGKAPAMEPPAVMGQLRGQVNLPRGVRANSASPIEGNRLSVSLRSNSVASDAAHEAGHLVGIISRGLPHRLPPPAEAQVARRLWSVPETQGYARAQWPNEHWANAFQEYLTNPARMRQPDVAAVASSLRRIVNEDPRFSQYFQLNNLAPFATAAAAGNALLNAASGEQ